jgi:hypothetical protein
MATLIEKLEKKSILDGGNVEYAKRLCVALGNPQEWDYQGECNDLGLPSGTCACGHSGIRYEFVLIHRTSNKREVVGSTCICHYFLINPVVAKRMADDYDILMKKLSDAKRESKINFQKEEIVILSEKYNSEYKKVRDKYDSYKNSGKYVPYQLWCIICKSDGALIDAKYVCQKYKNFGSQLNALKRWIGKFEMVLK